MHSRPYAYKRICIRYVYTYTYTRRPRIHVYTVCPYVPYVPNLGRHWVPNLGRHWVPNLSKLFLVLGPLAELSPREGGAQVPRVSGGGRLLVGARRVGRRRQGTRTEFGMPLAKSPLRTLVHLTN